MNICFLLGGFTGIGGIGRVTSILANKLCQDEAYKIYVLSYYDNKKANNYKLDARIKCDYLFGQPLNMTKGIMRGGVFKLRKYLINNEIDILVACGEIYFPITIFSTIGMRTQTVCWEHSNATVADEHSYQRLCRRIGAKNADRLVNLTKHGKKLYLKKYKNIFVDQIYNPIDDEIFKYTKHYNMNSKRILSVGRFCYQKNFELLIDIANVILHKNNDWTWEIYGDGESRGTLENMIKSYGLDNRILLKGTVNNLYELYPDYAFLVMTSRFEGFPMTLLEGSAHGLPLISFDILTGPNEIIHNGDNGFLIEAFNKEEMISKITCLIENQEERLRMSKTARERSKQYRVNEIVNQWKSLFEEMKN